MSVHRVISLASIPPRFADLSQCLVSLVGQGSFDVRLYIPSRFTRFPDWSGELPAVPRGVTIVRCEQDYGPATKILPACREFAGTPTQILFCDDDVIYPRGWAKRLFDLQLKRPRQAVAAYVRPARGYVKRGRKLSDLLRARQLPIEYDIPYRLSRLWSKLFGTETFQRRPFVIPGHGDIFFGVGGCVVRPGFFSKHSYEIPPECFFVDDVWLSACLARAGVRIYCPWMAALPRPANASGVDALVDTCFEGLNRQELNSVAATYCQRYFGIWV